jgi:hypothetical protein
VNRTDRPARIDRSRNRIMLAVTLAQRLQIEDLVDERVRLGVRGAASRAGRMVLALAHARASAARWV